MWEWCDKLKLGKPSAFIKRDIRALPQTETEFEAEFFLDPRFSTEDEEAWTGVVIEREHGAVLAVANMQMPPPTVNCLATLLADAMLRPQYGDHQRPTTIHLRDRPQWQELLPHLRQLGIEVILGDNLPRSDEAVITWMQEMKKPPSAEKVKAILRLPFPERERTWVTDARELMEWSAGMAKGAYPRRNVPHPTYEPTTVVSILLTHDELKGILTNTDLARKRKLRPRLEAMTAENKRIELEVTEWRSLLFSLCWPEVRDESARRHYHDIGRRIADQLAEALGIDGPPPPVE